jgi:hypothetical protein
MAACHITPQLIAAPVAGAIAAPPALGPLADNGGPTLTHAPQSGSPAINAGDNATVTANNLTTDQRGFARISGGTVDIGAVEIQYTTYDITVDPASINEGDSGTTDATVTVTRSDATSAASSVDLALSGSANENDDYTLALTSSGASFDDQTGTLSFDAGVTAATFALGVQGSSPLL